MRFLLLIGGVMLLFSGCALNNEYSEKTFSNAAANVSSVHSEGLDKTILQDAFIVNFGSDIVGLADSIHLELNNVYNKGEKLFSPTRREDLALIHSFETSDKKDGKEVKKYVIGGDIVLTDFTTKESIQERKDNECFKVNKETKKCEAYILYEDICTDYIYKLGAKISISELSKTSPLFSKYYELEKTFSSCNQLGKPKNLPVLSSKLSLLSKDIAQKFISDLLPIKKTVNVPFLQNEDIYYSIMERNLLNNGIKAFSYGKAESLEIFKKLVHKTRGYSSTALFNLGLTHESQKDFKKALEYYQKAFKVASSQKNISRHIIDAVQRVKKSIKFKGLL